MEEQNEQEALEWSTDDLPMAAFILSEGIECERIEVIDGQGTWIYKNSRQLRGITRAFLAGKAQVEPGHFHRCCTTVKRAMFNVLDARRSA